MHFVTMPLAFCNIKRCNEPNIKLWAVDSQNLMSLSLVPYSCYVQCLIFGRYYQNFRSKILTYLILHQNYLWFDKISVYLCCSIVARKCQHLFSCFQLFAIINSFMINNFRSIFYSLLYFYIFVQISFNFLQGKSN